MPTGLQCLINEAVPSLKSWLGEGEAAFAGTPVQAGEPGLPSPEPQGG